MRKESKAKKVYFYDEDGELLKYANSFTNFSNKIKQLLEKERTEAWLITQMQKGGATVALSATVDLQKEVKKNDVVPTLHMNDFLI